MPLGNECPQDHAGYRARGSVAEKADLAHLKIQNRRDGDRVERSASDAYIVKTANGVVEKIDRNDQ